METRKRTIILDTLKGIAIIAIAIYHFGGGVLPHGYLGVEIFFVVAGYLFIKDLCKKLEEKTFSYLDFVIRKVNRIWPLVLIVICISLTLGYFLMLPDDYEYLAESSLASAVFLNNFLSCITVKNYWKAVNLYRPLMHLWYIGVLMQAYICIPLIYILVDKFSSRSKKRAFCYTTVIISLVSLVIYLLPIFNDSIKFYLLPFRAFEICSGGCVAFLPKKCDKKTTLVNILSFCVLFYTMISRKVFPNYIMVTLVTLLTAVLIYFSKEPKNQILGSVERALALIGRRSYSIYIWHQFVIAFAFYSFLTKQNAISFIVVLFFSGVMSELSYRLIELKMHDLAWFNNKESILAVICFANAMCICVISIILYLASGVVRDVPELDIYKDSVHKNMHSEYCDRPYDWDVDFYDNSRKNVLVIGNSFARDWANILFEYDVDSALEISYAYYTPQKMVDLANRIQDAEIVFYALGPEAKNDVPKDVLSCVPLEKLYVIGNKKFGTSNGLVYANRKKDTYYLSTAEVPRWLLEMNEEQKSIYGNHYCDMIEPVMPTTNTIRVFTDDRKYISQDCSHLTKAGARYYSRILDIKTFLK